MDLEESKVQISKYSDVLDLRTLAPEEIQKVIKDNSTLVLERVPE
jgi:hypothetical protein